MTKNECVYPYMFELKHERVLVEYWNFHVWGVEGDSVAVKKTELLSGDTTNDVNCWIGEYVFILFSI